MGDTPLKSSCARSCVLCLPATIGIAQAMDLHQQFDDALNSGHSLVIDGSAVEQVDGAALQLLLAFHLAAGRLDRAPGWRNPSSSLSEATVLLGLESTLGLAPVSPDSTQSQKGN